MWLSFQNPELNSGVYLYFCYNTTMIQLNAFHFLSLKKKEKDLKLMINNQLSMERKRKRRESTPIIDHSFFFSFFFFLKDLFILLIDWLLCWVFVSVLGLSLVAASGGYSSSWCAGLSVSRPLLLQSTGSRRAGSVVVAHGPSRSTACGIFPDQGSNLCPLH